MPCRAVLDLRQKQSFIILIPGLLKCQYLVYHAFLHYFFIFFNKILNLGYQDFWHLVRFFKPNSKPYLFVYYVLREKDGKRSFYLPMCFLFQEAHYLLEALNPLGITQQFAVTDNNVNRNFKNRVYIPLLCIINQSASCADLLRYQYPQ